jgi:hypothetical protein
MIKRLKYSSPILLLLFISSTLFAKPNLKDSQNAYNYWAQRGIIEMVYANMQDYLAKVDASDTNQEKTLIVDYKNKYIIKIDSISSKELDSNFQSINKFLKDNKWNKDGLRICQFLIDKYNNKTPLISQFFSIKTTTNNNKFWIEKEMQILENYNKELSGLKSILTINDNQINPELKPNSLLYYGFVLIFFIGGIFIGGIIIYLYSSSNIYNILSNDKDEYFKRLNRHHGKYLFNYLQLVEILKESKDAKKIERDELRTQINLLNNDSEKSRSRYDRSDSKSTNDVKIVEVVTNKEIEEIEKETPSNVIIWKVEPSVEKTTSKTTNEIYFTIPENDGSFKVTNGKNTKGVDCFYKIEIDKNGQKGKLHFISGNYDSRALDNIDYYLNPVCEIENITERTHARKIQMKESGNVLMSSDSWKIDINHKVKIKFI